MSITISDTEPEPIALIAISAPTPPPDTFKKSPVAYKLPSFVIVFVPGVNPTDVAPPPANLTFSALPTLN